VVYDDGAVSCERTWSTLLEESFVGLIQSDTVLKATDMGNSTSRMYFTRVLYGMPLTTTPDMSWSSLGTTRCAATVAARDAT
jgi:hypothetical protein